jgi:hypothetical protein
LSDRGHGAAGFKPHYAIEQEILAEFDRLKLKVAELEGKLWDAQDEPQQPDKSLEQKIQRIFDDNTRDADCHEACIPREYYGEVILEILALLKPPQPRGYGEPKKESCSYCNRFDKCPVREFLFETKRSNKRCYFAEEFSCSNWQKQPEQEPSHWTPEGRYAAQTPCYGYNNPHQR